MYSYIDLPRKLHTLSRGMKEGENPHSMAGSLNQGASKDAMVGRGQTVPAHGVRAAAARRGFGRFQAEVEQHRRKLKRLRC